MKKVREERDLLILTGGMHPKERGCGEIDQLSELTSKIATLGSRRNLDIPSDWGKRDWVKNSGGIKRDAGQLLLQRAAREYTNM